LTKDQNVQVGASIGDGNKEIELRLKKLVDAGVDIISLETSHADNDHTINVIKKIKKLYPQVDLSVSLLVTGEATKRVIQAGADSIRVGIGGGSHCTTRLVTGVGRPQLSAVLECSKVAKKYKVPVISDTGIKYSGDIAKAIAFGADAVMVGGLFSATEETPGKIFFSKGKRYKMTWGMCTNTALQYDQLLSFIFKNPKTTLAKLKHPKQILWFFLNQQKKKFFEEGVEKKIPYKGSVLPIIKDLENGLIRSMWYIGAHNLKEIQSKSKIVLVTPSTKLENVPRI
jgi:IMP dehydrogenase